jgi:Uma2 family endonuclease
MPTVGFNGFRPEPAGTALASDDVRMRLMQQVRPRMRFADLERMPEDGRRYELYDGKLSEVPSPLPVHQRVAINVVESLREYERASGGRVFIAPLDIVLDEYNVVQPDIVFFMAERAGAINMHRVIRLPPDLAVEVLSPSTEQTDRGRKLRLLARFGVREYWLVDPVGQTVELLVLDDDHYALGQTAGVRDTITSRALPALSVSAARVFAD